MLGLAGFHARGAPLVFDGNVADSARDEGLVRARAEAAEEHGGLLRLGDAGNARRRQAGRGPSKGGGTGRESDDELHFC